MNLKTLCLALFLLTNYALAQDPWESYKPGALDQFIQQHASEIVKTRGQKKGVSMTSSDWVFLVSEFESTGQQPGASQKSGGKAPAPAVTESKLIAIHKLFKEGIACEDAGDLKGAIEIYQKIMRLDPRNKYAMNAIAGLFGRLGEFEQELAWTQKAIAIDPQFDNAYINYSSALIGLKRYDEAADACKKAIRINPKSPLGVYNLGVIEEEQGNFEKALELYWQSIQIDPQFENGYFNLAAMYANLKQFDKAIAALQILIKLNPQNESARAMLRQIKKTRG